MVSAVIWRPKPEAAPTAEESKRATASAQAKAYEGLLAALRSGNAAAFQERLSAAGRAEMAASGVDLPVQMRLIQEMAPKHPRYLKLVVDGNWAELKAADGRITLVFEEGQWRILAMDWDL